MSMCFSRFLERGDVGQNTVARLFIFFLLQQRATGFCKRFFFLFVCFIIHFAARSRFGCAAMCFCVLNLNNYWNIIFTWNISHGSFSILLFFLAWFSLFTLIDVVFFVCLPATYWAKNGVKCLWLDTSWIVDSFIVFFNLLVLSGFI